ncbi:alpha/beta hydrolase-fold protein [Crocinitomicaceae bacterium]|nr:alpha/beta hydrolase-fold protein [Crocinitomicaceae bacterium]MDB3907214.1 alpha/beta hydrolase-fold protein [Crocinitomicaceae bacterium]
MKLLFLFFICLSFQITAQNVSEFSIGDRIIMDSEILDEERILNVYLPYGYSPDSTKTYPVIYLLDGSAHEDFIHVAGLVQFGSYSWINIVPESIVVGIENVSRNRDFTGETRNSLHKDAYPEMGGSANFIQYLDSEVFAYIDDNYNTTDERTIIGQSLGGLLATEILLKQPQMFNNYIIISPSLWFDYESYLDIEMKQTQEKLKIYVGVGDEGKIMKNAAKKLHKKLKKELKENDQLSWGYFKDNDHGDVLHFAVYDAFEHFFNQEK